MLPRWRTVVTGMIERERRTADVQRLAWLADATLGPALPAATRRDRRKEGHLSLRMKFRCRGFVLTPWFSQRVCLSRQRAI